MKKEILYEAIGGIDDSYVREAHTVPKKNFRPIWKKWGARAACFCLLLAAVFAIPHLFEQPPDIVPTDTNRPQYIPAFTSPELDALYKEEPYSILIPRKMPETFELKSSYKIEYDPIANPDSKKYLHLCFKSEQIDSSIEIKVMEYEGKGAIADPAKTDTYDISLYYDYLKTPGTVGADAPDVLEAIFCAEDLSTSIVEKRMYVFDDGLCNVEIQILCGDYVVGYHYVGPEISSESLYEVITSSQYFLETSDITAE